MSYFFDVENRSGKNALQSDTIERDSNVVPGGDGGVTFRDMLTGAMLTSEYQESVVRRTSSYLHMDMNIVVVVLLLELGNRSGR